MQYFWHCVEKTYGDGEYAPKDLRYLMPLSVFIVPIRVNLSLLLLSLREREHDQKLQCVLSPTKYIISSIEGRICPQLSQMVTRSLVFLYM